MRGKFARCLFFRDSIGGSLFFFVWEEEEQDIEHDRVEAVKVVDGQPFAA